MCDNTNNNKQTQNAINNNHQNNINSSGDANNNSSSSSSSSHSSIANAADIDKQRKLYAIIDNLSQLSLGDKRLPLITLSDYTQQVALYGANFDLIAIEADNCQMQIPNEDRPPT